ncbi:hypothetical protein EDC22_104215 [Tepidamorphus gemmatus]|uniref:Uncharacterized protein n=2 Tax=Tepidamorphus gemmatus TaxID=747076 RepID=A0A4R3MEL2_9HYPH|nr:hypothetical protein EDC22_104215 [Tepidamorphus gemmatus]
MRGRSDIELRPLAACVLAAGLLALGGCETAPDLERLAPPVQKLRTETPESRHPTTDQEFPNINNAPDRPSVMRTQSEIEEIEKDLEATGASHVKEADQKITAEKPAPATSVRPAPEPSTDLRPPQRPAEQGETTDQPAAPPAAESPS